MRQLASARAWSPRRVSAKFLVLPATLICIAMVAQSPGTLHVKRVEGHVATPGRVPFERSLVQRLQAQPDFEVSLFASGLERPRMLAVWNGNIYVTQPVQGRVVRLRYTTPAGQEPRADAVIDNLDGVHGIAFNRDRMFMATITQVYQADMRPDGTAGQRRLLIDRLPDGGQHPNRTLALDPEGNLYVSIGSTCNSCDEPNPEHAAMLRFTADGKNRTIFARGLRNTVGFAFHPDTGEMWGMDHGSDWRGDDLPPEELNRILADGHYGWPYCYGDRVPDELTVSEPEGMSKAEFCGNRTIGSTLAYRPAHSAPLGMVFYDGAQFPPEYRGDAFIAMRGSWNRNPPSGYKIVRLRFRNGKPVGFEDFVTGLLVDNGSAYIGRPVGMAVAPDGALLFTDDSNGAIYRVSHTGRASRVK